MSKRTPQLSLLLTVAVALAWFATDPSLLVRGQAQPPEVLSRTASAPSAYEPRVRATASQDDLLAEVLAAGVLVVATDPNFAPWSFINDQGELDGFDVDVAKEVAARLGVELEFVTPEWSLIIAGDWNGLWDVSIGSMTPTDERAQALWFTRPYYYVNAVFAVHKDNSDLTDVGDLAGHRVGVGTGTAYEDYLLGQLDMGDYGGVFSYPPPDGVEIQAYSMDAEAIEDLQLGDGVRLDAVLSNHPMIQNAIDWGLPLKYLGTSAFSEPTVFALDQARGTSDLMLAELNRIIEEMHGDGTLTDISIKWLGIDVSQPGEPWDPPYRVFLPLALR